jgi:hypothetical protein
MAASAPASAAASATKHASAPASRPASAPRRAASATKPKTAPASAVETPRVFSPAPAPTPAREEPKASASPSNAGNAAAVDACKDKVFLSREFCLAEACDKPGTRNHPLCVKRREEVRLREESKQRQGPQ